jgi:hypothetical protein
VRATERSFRERAGLAMTEAVELYDRQLESWLKAKLARLIELYETQAAAFREQIRRLATERTDAGIAGNDAALEAELRGLRATNAEAVPVQPGLLQADRD